MIEVLLEAVRLKRVARAGWVRKGVPNPESVAAHSWGVAWLVLALLPEDLNRERALAYAVLHDLAEVRVGDLMPSDGVPRDEKHRREAEAMDALTAPIGRDLNALWQMYEAQADPESQFVRQLDRLDMALQARVYADETGEDLGEFITSARRAIHHPDLVALLDQL